MNNKFLLVGILVLAGCSLTQPKAPVINGLTYDVKKSTHSKVKPLSVRKLKQIPKIVEKITTVKKKVYHIVKQGDYVYSVARKYKVAPNTIIKKNKLKKPYKLMKGDKLYIKTVSKTVKVKVKQTSKNVYKKPQRYSLTRNPKLYKHPKKISKRIRRSLPVQDFKRPSKDKNVDFGYHKVKRGENLFRIGKKYDVSVFDLMAYNDLRKPEELKAGTELKIAVAKPVGTKYSHEETSVLESGDKGSVKIALIDEATSRKKGFAYPVKGRIISKFGKHGHGIRNDGIDIAVSAGTPVVATQSGTVMYAQNISTLGKMVLVKHSRGYISAYTHNSKLLVSKGQKIAKGRVVALSGDSGNAKQPMLHFELRRYGKAINPTRLLH
ncbi:MAG: peptidoglycan DD-metalloendopeptidase family protein [Proteobacteria bacterium]|nr:peptidoglycan DD-metalloendopeptidase family protein [Pseudomonadota bacterium]